MSLPSIGGRRGTAETSPGTTRSAASTDVAVFLARRGSEVRR